MKIESLKKELSDLGPKVSGATIVQKFEGVAFESWEGAEALIDAYLELTENTGEIPSIEIIGNELYLVIKAYWNENLEIKKLAKLDSFLSSIN